jgi:hypothetical protein
MSQPKDYAWTALLVLIGIGLALYLSRPSTPGVGESASHGGKVRWGSDLDAGLAEAGQRQTAVMLLFTADW